MSEISSFSDSLNDNDYQSKKMPTGINVLTILTIVGCVIFFCFSVWGFISAKASFDKKDQVIEQMQSGKLPGWAKSMMPDMAHFDEMVTKSYENRIPILIMSLISLGLCFVGALQMRKLKKQGYLLYVIGELLPILTSIVFIGVFSLKGFSAYFGYFIALLFILLYTGQKKYLVK